MVNRDKEPKYHLDVYRQFIREASPYISLVIGRKVTPKQAETMSDEELSRIAVIIDERVDDLKKRPSGK